MICLFHSIWYNPVCILVQFPVYVFLVLIYQLLYQRIISWPISYTVVLISYCIWYYFFIIILFGIFFYVYQHIYPCIHWVIPVVFIGILPTWHGSMADIKGPMQVECRTEAYQRVYGKWICAIVHPTISYNLEDEMSWISPPTRGKVVQSGRPLHPKKKFKQTMKKVSDIQWY